MKKQEIMKAIEMKLNGLSYDEIGTAFECSEQYIKKSIISALEINEKGKTQPSNKIVKYHNIQTWIDENCLSLNDFCKTYGFLKCTMERIIYGECDPSFQTINKLTKITRQPFEWVFEENK